MAIWILLGPVGFAVALAGKLKRSENESSICQLRNQGSGTTVRDILFVGVDAEIFSIKSSLRKTHFAGCFLILIFIAWAP